MPIRQGKKITELTQLNSASLNTYIVGVDNSITYKIPINVLENTVVDLFSSSVDARLDAIELYTASFTASTDISSLNEYTQSTNNRLDGIEIETSSYLKSEGAEEFYIPVFSSGTILLTSSIALDRGNVIIGSSASAHTEVPEKLAVYAGDTDSYNLISGHGSINNYLQLNIKNFGTFGNSSSDVVATADNGNEEEFYIDMGINGSNYDENTIVGSANDTYIYGTGYNFHVGNASQYPVMIFAGGFDAGGENLKLIIDPFDNHTMTGSFEISGNFTCLGNIVGDIEFSNLLNVPTIISSSQQITDFGFISSSQSIDTGSFATTGSNTFNDNQTINGSITLQNGAVIKDTPNYGVSFGYQAGLTNQGTQSLALGNGAGYDNQSHGTVAVGTNAGAINQGLRAVALGSLAGTYNQGEYAIAIGNFAAPNNQGANSIVISATGTGLENTTPNSLVIAPIRNISGGDGILQYNNTTKEVSYSNEFTGSLSITGSVNIVGSGSLNGDGIVASNTIMKIETISSASYAEITPVSGTLYIIIG